LIGLVLAAAGTGSRFGSNTPKQFTELEGKPLYLHALECFLKFFDEAAIVVPEDWFENVSKQVQGLPYGEKLLLEVGGPERQDSVFRGLRRLSDSNEVVLVHDAARPSPSAELISQVIDGTRQHEACIPVLPVGDTVKEVHDKTITGTLDRKSLVLAQTPQGFKMALLQSAFESALEDGFYGTDESTLVERLGVPVHVVPGEGTNLKITWKEDW